MLPFAADARVGVLLARDPAPEVRAAVALFWSDMPDDVSRALLTDPVEKVRADWFRYHPRRTPPADLIPGLLDDPATRAAAIRHATLTPPLMERLAADPDSDVRRELAAVRGLPAALRDRLAEDRSARVRLAVFTRSDTASAMRRHIHDAILGGAAAADWNRDMDDAELEQWIENEYAVTELAMLHLPWVTADPLPHVSSPYACFRRSAAAHPALPPEVVRRLLDDEDNSVAVAAARSAPHLVDPATAERIEREYRPAKRMRWRPADDLGFPTESLRRFATDDDPRVRCLAPRDPDLPAEIIVRLAGDPDPQVRAAVAAHPRLPGPVLARLLHDDESWVARAAAAAPALPVSEMERLVPGERSGGFWDRARVAAGIVRGRLDRGRR
ncbi:hypothetical protein [Catenuloplanes japonicus]|uniref:hypothetical protein n=1 Tax=Catenuloplanes japonicus TaxID=33876 RepID=UPI0007C57B29|nr:hypothetical protein [Catenuloplanes japonicus]